MASDIITLVQEDVTAIVPTAPFNQVALQRIVEMWAKVRTNPKSPDARHLQQTRVNVVMGCLDFCHKAPGAVTPDDIQAYQAELEQSGLSTNTVYTYLQLVSSFYTWAMRVPALRAMIGQNPVQLVKPQAPKPYTSEKIKTLTDEQVQDLIGVVATVATAELTATATDMEQRQRLVAKRDLAILILFLTTGLRRREVLQLKWGDVTFHKGGGLTLRVEVKTGKRRTLRIDDPTPQQALLDYLDTTGRRAHIKSGSPLWISHDRGSTGRAIKDGAKDKERPLTSLAFYKKLKAYGKQIDLPSIYTHQTRHTYASWVLQRSKSLHEVKEALGHEHEATTRHYIPAIGEEPDRGSAVFVQRLNLPTILPAAEELLSDVDS